jgi:hypothetical protein
MWEVISPFQFAITADAKPLNFTLLCGNRGIRDGFECHRPLFGLIILMGLFLWVRGRCLSLVQQPYQSHHRSA